MEKIKQKIVELIRLSNKKFDDFGKGWDAIKAKSDAQNALMDELRELAVANDTMLGRIIKFPVADGYAMYVITKVNKKTVRIVWIDYMDGWVDQRCGYEAAMDINYAKQVTDGESALRKIFS